MQNLDGLFFLRFGAIGLAAAVPSLAAACRQMGAQGVKRIQPAGLG